MVCNILGKRVKQLPAIHPEQSLDKLHDGVLRFFDGKALYCYFGAGLNHTL